MSETFYKAWKRSIGLEPKLADDAMRHTAENIRVTLSLNDVAQAETLMRLLDVYIEQIDEYCLAHEGSPDAEKLLPNFDCANEMRGDLGDYLQANAPKAYDSVRAWFDRPVISIDEAIAKEKLVESQQKLA